MLDRILNPDAQIYKDLAVRDMILFSPHGTSLIFKLACDVCP